ncbi:MAG: hypothetical protein N3A57_05605, partial [Negativicutes bacterium]|nr:hypothetical protein [Negativicutes bacterium]
PGRPAEEINQAVEWADGCPGRAITCLERDNRSGRPANVLLNRLLAGQDVYLGEFDVDPLAAVDYGLVILRQEIKRRLGGGGVNKTGQFAGMAGVLRHYSVNDLIELAEYTNETRQLVGKMPNARLIFREWLCEISGGKSFVA